jgi:hypothetical protein
MNDENDRVTQPDLTQEVVAKVVAQSELKVMTADRDRWRERFMVLRSRLHGLRDSLHKLDSELGRIIDEK